MRTVWPDTIVEENNLNKNISILRKLLGESSDKKYIETLPKRGYRFVAPVREVWDEGTDLGLRIENEGGREGETEGWRDEEIESGGEGKEKVAPSTVSLPLSLSPSPPSTIALPGGRGWKLNQKILISSIFLVGLVVGIAYLWILTQSRLTDAGAAVRSLAVLPLENLSGDAEQEYFADGMTEALITDLAQIKALRVISRTSVMQYKGARQPLPEIAQKLKIDAVVEGAVQRSGDRVRITVQLVQAATDRHLWAKSYERDLGDILALQNEVAQAIAQEIKIKLTPQEQTRMARARPVHREAYDAYLKGRYFWWNNATEEGLRKSIDYFQQAVEKDPSYALAYAGLADAYIRFGTSGRLPPSELLPKAKGAAVRAVELDDMLGEAHTALGEVKVAYEWDFAGAEREFQRALELNPRYAHAHFWYGNLLVATGRQEAAVAQLKGAQDLDPLSLAVNHTVALVFYYAGQYDRAIEQARHLIEMDPNYWMGHWDLGLGYEQKEMYEEAIREFQKAINISRQLRIIESLGHAYAVSGKRKEAERLLDELKQLFQRRYVPPYFISMIYAGLGEKDQAFEWLHKAYEGRDRQLMWLKVDPRFHSLRSDPRFADLLRRVGLPP